MFTVLIIGAIATGLILFSIDSKVYTAMGGGHLTVFSWRMKNQLDVTCYILFHLLCPQHVSDFNISIFVLVVFVLQAEAVLQPAKRTPPNISRSKSSNTQRTENKTTDVVIHQHNRRLLKKDILMSETCWARNKWNKIASDIKLAYYVLNTRQYQTKVRIIITVYIDSQTSYTEGTHCMANASQNFITSSILFFISLYLSCTLPIISFATVYFSIYRSQKLKVQNISLRGVFPSRY